MATIRVYSTVSPLPGWWPGREDLQPGVPLEVPLPALGLWPLDTPVLLTDPDNHPVAMITLSEVKTSADGSTAAGVVLRVFTQLQRTFLKVMLTPPRPAGAAA